MNTKELKTAKAYREWADILLQVRKELNEIRKKPEKNPYTEHPPAPLGTDKTLFKKGDLVHVKLEPKNAFNKKVHGDKFREGDFRIDTVPRKIKRVLFYSGDVPHRYIVNGINGASFTDAELKKATSDVEKFVIKGIIGKTTLKGQIFYLIQ